MISNEDLSFKYPLNMWFFIPSRFQILICKEEDKKKKKKKMKKNQKDDDVARIETSSV